MASKQEYKEALEYLKTLESEKYSKIHSLREYPRSKPKDYNWAVSDDIEKEKNHISLAIELIKQKTGVEGYRLPVGTEVTMKKCGSKKKITGHCTFLGQDKGYIVDGYGIFIDSDFK